VTPVTAAYAEIIGGAAGGVALGVTVCLALRYAWLRLCGRMGWRGPW
jgi:hypothetical protein